MLDTRDPTEYAGAHLRGSVNVGLGGSYATWCGTLLDPARPIVIVADPGREEESATRLGRIGFDNVAGYLSGGMRGARRATRSRRAGPSGSRRRTSPSSSARRARRSCSTFARRGEVEAGHIEGSLNVPLNHLEERLDEIPRDGPIVVTCASGYRSSIAVSLLEAARPAGVTDLVGGMGAWEASRLATTGAR